MKKFKKTRKLVALSLLVIIFMIVFLSKFSSEDMLKIIDSHPTASYIILVVVLAILVPTAVIVWFVRTLFRMRDGK